MEEFSPRRRDVKREAAFSSLKKLKTDLWLTEILLIFTTSTVHPTIPGMYDPVSMSLRALLLCELALKGSVRISDRNILIPSDTYMPTDEIHDEVYNKIKGSATQRPVDKWLLLLNGETYALKKDKYHIKHTRKRIADMLVDKRILKKSRSRTKELLAYITNKKIESATAEDITLKGIKSKISLEMTTYLTGEALYEETDIVKLEILVCAFVFCNVIEDLYLTLSPSASETAQKKVQDIISKYKTSLGDTSKPIFWSVYSILRAYLKFASWV